MRICHGLAGTALEVEDQELQYRKPIDIIRQHARERWEVDADDLIVLSDGGGTVGPGCEAEDLGPSRDVFLFRRSALDPQATVVPDLLESYPGAADAGQGEERLPGDEDPEMDLRMADPAYEAFRSNIAQARKLVAGARPMAAIAACAEARLKMQRLAARAVLDNLTSHRATCSRSMSLFLHKYEKVQDKFTHNLGKVEASMAALGDVTLHPAMRSEGRESLKDVVPCERILRFTSSLQAERARLSHRLGKLRQQDASAQTLCDQMTGTMQQMLQDDAIAKAAGDIRDEIARVEGQLLPELRNLVPSEGASPPEVLEEEKRSAGLLEGLHRVCAGIRDMLAELQACWTRQHAHFLQRLREVAYIQSKVRSVESQAALLEEEINVQHGYSQQLNHLQQMPKAYHRALGEVARRRQFRARYLAQAEQARNSLARMMDEENSRRRAFTSRYGCHLPADLVRGLGALAPPVTLEVPDFDNQLPEVNLASLNEVVEHQGTGGPYSELDESARPSAASGGATAESMARVGGSSCSSSLRSPGGLGASACGGGLAGSSSGASMSGSRTTATRMDELESRNRDLEAKVDSLMQELTKSRSTGSCATGTSTGGAALAPPSEGSAAVASASPSVTGDPWQTPLEEEAAPPEAATERDVEEPEAQSNVQQEEADEETMLEQEQEEGEQDDEEQPPRRGARPADSAAACGG